MKQIKKNQLLSVICSIISIALYGQPTYTVDPSLYQYSMTFTTTLQIDGSESRDTADAIYAFVNGECRGIAHPIDYLKDQKRYVAFLMVYGNNVEGDSVTFIIYNASKNKEIKLFNHVPFLSNAIYGTPVNPLINVVENDLTAYNFFSPNGDGVNDTWQLTYSKLYLDFRVFVYNQIGKQIYYKKSNYQNDWDGQWDGKTLPNGMYYYLVMSPDKQFVYKGIINLIK